MSPAKDKVFAPVIILAASKVMSFFVPPSSPVITTLPPSVIASTLVKSSAPSDSTSPLSVNTPPVRLNPFTSAPSNVIALPLAPVSPVTVRSKSPVTSAKATAALVPPVATSSTLLAVKVIDSTFVDKSNALSDVMFAESEIMSSPPTPSIVRLLTSKLPFKVNVLAPSSPAPSKSIFRVGVPLFNVTDPNVISSPISCNSMTLALSETGARLISPPVAVNMFVPVPLRSIAETLEFAVIEPLFAVRSTLSPKSSLVLMF